LKLKSEELVSQAFAFTSSTCTATFGRCSRAARLRWSTSRSWRGRPRGALIGSSGGSATTASSSQPIRRLRSSTQTQAAKPRRRSARPVNYFSVPTNRECLALSLFDDAASRLSLLFLRSKGASSNPPDPPSSCTTARGLLGPSRRRRPRIRAAAAATRVYFRQRANFARCQNKAFLVRSENSKVLFFSLFKSFLFCG
jgi:hypothetical protein